MRRGTTPTLTFTTPYAAENIVNGYITFNQRGTTVLEKQIPGDGVTVNDNSIALELTQEETLLFTANMSMPAQAQIRLLLQGGTATASNIVEIPICAILKDGEIT